MATKTVKISTTAKLKGQNGQPDQEIESGEIALNYTEPDSLQAAVEAFGEAKCHDLLTSELRTRFSNSARAALRDDLVEVLKGNGSQEEVIEGIRGFYNENWNPNTPSRGQVDPEAALRAELAGKTPEEAMAFLAQRFGLQIPS